jgi:hypothetical protein
VLGDAGHPSKKGGGQEKNHWKKEGQVGGEAQGVADSPTLENFSNNMVTTYVTRYIHM